MSYEIFFFETNFCCISSDWYLYIEKGNFENKLTAAMPIIYFLWFAVVSGKYTWDIELQFLSNSFSSLIIGIFVSLKHNKSTLYPAWKKALSVV